MIICIIYDKLLMFRSHYNLSACIMKLMTCFAADSITYFARGIPPIWTYLTGGYGAEIGPDGIHCRIHCGQRELPLTNLSALLH